MGKKYSFISYIRDKKDFRVDVDGFLQLRTDQAYATAMSANPIEIISYASYGLATEHKLSTWDGYLLDYFSGSTLRQLDGY